MNLTEKYQVLPSMNPEQFEALKADIKERGVLTPIDVDDKGNILDGHHRYRACVELGITDFPTILRVGLDEAEKRMFARKSNMLRRHLTQEQMRDIIASQLKDTPNWANNRIAQELGVDSKTVQSMREKLEATLEIPKLDKLIGADGKERPVKQPRKPSIMLANEAEYNEVMNHLAESIADITGNSFISIRDGMVMLVDKGYDPMYGLNKTEAKEWELFFDFLGGNNGFPDVSYHIEWIRGRDFRTPTGWLGAQGREWRASVGMKEPSEKLNTAWQRYLNDKQAVLT